MKKAELEARVRILEMDVAEARYVAVQAKLAAILELGRREAAERDKDALERYVATAMMELPEGRPDDLDDAVRQARAILREIEQREAEDASYEGR